MFKKEVDPEHECIWLTGGTAKPNAPVVLQKNWQLDKCYVYNLLEEESNYLSSTDCDKE